MWDFTRIVLIPSKETSPKPQDRENSNLLSLHKFVGEMKQSRMVYVLVGMNNTKSTMIPEPVNSLTEEFQDVFPSDILNELSPLRGIQHQIDLVLGSNLPNRPHYYWMSPKKHEEL